MPQICATIPVPTFSALFNGIQFPTFPPTIELPDFVIPALPSIRNPLLENIKNPGLALANIAQDLQVLQQQITMMNVIQPIVQYVGGVLSSLIPKIPGTNLSLIDLVTLNPQALYQNLIGAFIPNPLFGNFSCPTLEDLQRAKLACRSYMATLVTWIKDLVKQATDKMGIQAMAALAAIPNLETLKSMAAGILTIPGYNNPEVLLNEGISILLADAIAAPLAFIVNFCQTALSALGFTFPLICVSF